MGIFLYSLFLSGGRNIVHVFNILTSNSDNRLLLLTVNALNEIDLVSAVQWGHGKWKTGYALRSVDSQLSKKFQISSDAVCVSELDFRSNFEGKGRTVWHKNNLFG